MLRVTSSNWAGVSGAPVVPWTLSGMPSEVIEPPTNSVATAPELAAVGAHVAGEEGVDVAGQERDVADAAVADVVEQLAPLPAVAVP